ncbi:MAG TPA: methyltransferase domain-containing protein [Solirubrobacteraceae bacterium]
MPLATKRSAPKVLITLATGLEDLERVTIAFLIGGAALARGDAAAMWLTQEAVRLATPGDAQGVGCDGCPPLERLFEQYAEAGGVLLACPICLGAGGGAIGDRLMSDARTTWGAGDYPRMAHELVSAAAVAVRAVHIDERDRVLDVACGDGNAALLAAQLGAQVTGVDLDPTLLDRARQRGTDGGVDVGWRLGDAAALPVAAGGFDVVLSIFGVMYVPDHDTAAAELARVCAPGARVALTAWAPGSFMPAMGAALGPYLPPPPPGGAPPSRWGDEDAARALLARHAISVEAAARERLELTFADRRAAVDFLIATAGHIIAERPRLVAEQRWDALVADLDDVVSRHDAGDDDGVVLPLVYLLVTARAVGSASEDEWPEWGRP